MTTATLTLINAMLSLLIALQSTPPDIPISSPAQTSIVRVLNNSEGKLTVPVVPFFSQFSDIASPVWQKRGCGIASLAMLIEYYEPNIIDVDILLNEGINAGGYIQNVGWIHSSLVSLAEAHGLRGTSYDLFFENADRAFAQFQSALLDGPLIASVHYTFDPKSAVPHLVVITGSNDTDLFYNDPADSSGGKSVSKDTFIRSWKKRYIEIRPV